MTFTDKDTPYTRIIEHKHFENIKSNDTWISYEYPTEYKADKNEPYYPVNDKENTLKYNKYKVMADKLNNVYFGGRLAEYKYYDMHQIIDSALTFLKTIDEKLTPNEYGFREIRRDLKKIK
jgi:UDP-galactopyranose mutase